MTLDCAEMDLGKKVFAQGQAYVALSRIKNLENLKLTDFDENSIQVNPIVKQYYAQLENKQHIDNKSTAIMKYNYGGIKFPTEEEIMKLAKEFQLPRKSISVQLEITNQIYNVTNNNNYKRKFEPEIHDIKKQKQQTISKYFVIN